MTATPQMLPVYLINGEDELKRETALKRLVARLAKMGDIDFNMETLNGETADGEAVVGACNTLPFCSEFRLVIVKNADKLAKPAAEMLVDYIGNPCQTTILALVSTKLAKNTRLYKAAAKVGSTAIIDCTPRKRWELPTQVKSMAVTYGVTIGPAAAELLVNLVGESTIRIDTELRKMAASMKEGQTTITEKNVEELVARTAEVKPWEFVDALSERDARKCTLLLSRMPGQSPHGLLAMSLTRIRELIAARALEGRGMGHQLASELGYPDWRVKNHRRWATGFTSEELKDALRHAADLEKRMKSGGDPDLLFEKWALDLCVSRNTRH